MDPVLIRQLVPSDLNFVFSVVLRDMRDADPSALPDDIFYPAHRQYLERVLGNPEVTTLVAAASDEPNEILGFVIAEPERVLHWIYIRKALRGQGIARRLLEAAKTAPGTPASWMTKLGRERLQNPRRSRQCRMPSLTVRRSKSSTSTSRMPTTAG